MDISALQNDKYTFASESDVPELIRLWQEAFADTAEDIKEYFDDYFAPTRVLVQRRDGGIAAMASLFEASDGENEAVYIYALAVKSSCRSRGIARDMIKHIINTLGTTVIVQPEKNGVEKFYSDIGFVPLPEKSFFEMCERHALVPLTLGSGDGMILRPVPAPDKLVFREIIPENMDCIIPFFTLRPNKSCDSTPMCLYLFRHIFEPRACIAGNACLVIFSEEPSREDSVLIDGKELAGSMPYCREEELSEYFKLQERYFNEVLQIPHILFSCDEEGVKRLSEDGTLDNYEVIDEEHFRDYLYDGEAMRTLAGRKYSKKRNLIHQFEKEYFGRWEYKRLTPEDRDGVLSFLRSWHQRRGDTGEDDSLLLAELRGIEDIFSCPSLFESFEFGAITVDGNIAAFSIGAYNPRERMAIIDVEKADHEVVGLYQMINREFLIHEYPDALIVNREDDVGEENLRQAKMSYHPIGFERKYTLRQKHFDLRRER